MMTVGARGLLPQLLPRREEGAGEEARVASNAGRMDTCPGNVQVRVGEVEVGAVVASVERMDIWPGSVPLEEVGTTSAGTAARFVLN